MGKQTIRGRIIRIIDTRTVIINLGQNHGVADGAIFQVLGDPEPVIDPASNQELGRVAVIKTKMKATQVESQFSIATTRWTITHYKQGALSRSVLGLSLSQFTDSYETEVVDEGELRVIPQELEPWKAQTEIPVRKGDVVEVTVDVKEEKAEMAEIE